MTAFWIAAALLCAAVLAFLLWPRRRGAVSREVLNTSVYRDQLRELDADLAAGTLARADYDRARRELEARLLEDVEIGDGYRFPNSEEIGTRPRFRGLTPTLLVAIPLLAFGVYFATGNPGAIDSPMLNLETMVERLASRLGDRPEDVEGWRLLARSYMAMGRFRDAADALERAAKIAPKSPDVLADLADILAVMHGGRLHGEPEKLVLRALELDPKHLKSLALAGTAAYDRKDYAAAAAYWQRMLPLLEPGSEDARAVQSNLEEAKRLLAAAKPLKGTVSLSAGLKGKAAPGDTVFIFARAAEGPAVPLAVMRAQVRDLPMSFALDDSMAMAPGARLSSFQRVIVTARVSKSGSPQAQAGDLQGASRPVANDAAGVHVVIDSEVR